MRTADQSYEEERGKTMILLQILWSFVKIGFTSFGGLSMIPLITSEMTVNGWMTAEEVSDIVAIAEMTPGPLGLNCATFAGMRTAGILGAIAANLGVLMPTLTIVAVAAVFLKRFKDSQFMNRVMTGVRPACVGMIMGLCISLSMTNYVEKQHPYFPYIIIGAVDVYLFYRKWSVPKVIGLNAAAGIVMFGMLGL